MNHTMLTFSLRRWLWGLSMLVMLSPALYAGLALRELAEQARQSSLNLLQQRADELSDDVRALLNTSVSTLQTLAQSDAAQRGDMAALHEQSLRVVRDNPSFRAISLVDESNKVVFLTSIPFGEPTIPANFPNLVREAMEQGRPNVSGIFFTRVSPDPLVVVTAPLKRRDTTTQVLRLVIATDTLNTILTNKPLPAGWLASIAERQGTLVARSVNAAKFVGQRMPEPFLAAMKSQRRTMFQSPSLDGTPVTSVSLPLMGGDWFFALAVPDAVLNAPAQDLFRKLALLGLLTLALGAGLAQVLSAYLNRQLRILGEELAAGPQSGRTSRLQILELMQVLRAHRSTQQANSALKEKLQQSENQRFEAQDLYEQAPCGYHSVNQEGVIVKINQTELNWLGYARDEVVGRPVTEFLTAASQEIFAQEFPHLLRLGRADDVEVELRCKDGSARPVLLTANVVRDGQGQFIESRSLLVDISQRKQFELSLLQAHSRLNQRRDQLETHAQAQSLAMAQAQDLATSAGQARVDWLQTFSHEMGTPLSQIVGHSILLSRELSDQASLAQVSAIHLAARQLLTMVNDLVDVARLETGSLRLVIGNFGLGTMVKEVLAGHQLSAQARGLTLTSELDAQLPARVAGDARRLSQILWHLLDHFIRHSTEGMIKVKVNLLAIEDAQNHLQFEVQHSGRGLAPAQVRQLIDLLLRDEGNIPQIHVGMHVGLGVSYRLVKLMGGAMGVDAAPDNGACVRFKIALTTASDSP
jgi:PAS domain S-box-containing protein